MTSMMTVVGLGRHWVERRDRTGTMPDVKGGGCNGEGERGGYENRMAGEG